MIHMTKRAAQVTAVVCLLLCLCGCWNSRELGDLSILMGVGIDQSPIDNRQIEVTVQLAKPASLKSEQGGGGGGGGGDKAYWNLTYTARDLFFAFRELTHQVSRKIYVPHNQLIMFGEDFARDGVQQSIDFFMRDPESRMEVLVMMARGKASDILAVTPQLEKVPAIDLAQMMEVQQANSHSVNIRLLDFIGKLVSDTSAPIMPIVEIVGEEEDQKLMYRGTAVFQKDKYVGDLDMEQTRGLLWVTGDVKSGALQVDVPGGSAALEIIRAKSKLTPMVKDDGTIVMKIQIYEEGSLASQSSTENLTDKNGIMLLERAAKEGIKAEIESAFSHSKELGADIFGFGEALRRRYPQMWKNLAQNWNEAYSEIELDIQVSTRIISTGRLTKPARPGME